MSKIDMPEKETEPERRFLVDREAYERLHKSKAPANIEQVYLDESGDWSVRSRKIEKSGRNTYLMTMKRSKSFGVCYEIEVPGTRHGHEQMLAHAGRCLRKTRTEIRLPKGLKAEIDDFLPSGLDLIIVEVELPSIDHEFQKPDWFGKEITGQKELSNAEIFRGISLSAD